MVYRATYKIIDRFAFLYRNIVNIPSENLMSLFSWPIMSFLSRLILRPFLWNILAHHLGNVLVNWSIFIPTFFFGYLLALHRDHFIGYHCRQDCSLGCILQFLLLFKNLSVYIAGHFQPCTQSQCCIPSSEYIF